MKYGLVRKDTISTWSLSSEVDSSGNDLLKAFTPCSQPTFHQGCCSEFAQRNIFNMDINYANWIIMFSKEGTI